MHRVVATAALAAALAIGLAACTPDEGGDPDAAPDDVVGQENHERSVGARLVDGRVPLDLALDRFAAAYGPIDGGDPGATGPAGPSGTGALLGVLAHWDALSADQRAAVEAAFGPVPYATAPIAVDFTGEVLDVETHGAIGMIGLPGGLTAPVATDFTARYCIDGSANAPTAPTCAAPRSRAPGWSGSG